MGAVKTTMAAEHQLLDMLKRIEGMRSGSVALHIKISALSPTNRTQNQVQMVSGLLNEVLAHSQVSLFVLTSKDIIVVGRAIPSHVLETAMQTVRRVFQSDSASNSFMQVYHLDRDFKTVMDIAKKQLENLQKTEKEGAQNIPLAPEHLDAILRNIKGFNILKIIRRQEAIRITPDGSISSLFQKYFTSMADLKKAIAPDVDVLSNRWLFQHLSETLDQRMIGICKELFAHTSRGLSLNLNISTIFTPLFENFLTEIPKMNPFIVEVQLMDIIQNARNYQAAKEYLHEAGHKILIDGLHPISFEFMDMALLDSDLLKMNWTPALTTPETSERLMQFLKEINPEKLILMRAEDEDALRWGLNNGITRFQGYYIDAVCGAKIRNSCPHKKGCTSEECVARKNSITGTLRTGCLAQERLDMPVEHTAEGRG